VLMLVSAKAGADINAMRQVEANKVERIDDPF
jgi:hypothetical protein